MTTPIMVRGLSLGEGMPKICVPLLGETEEELLSSAREALGGAEESEGAPVCDMAEWRADSFGLLKNGFGEEEKASLLDTLASLREAVPGIPLLFTFRTKEEGGRTAISYEEYRELNLCVAESGLADFIDIQPFLNEKEAADLTRAIQGFGVRVVASFHDFQRTPLPGELLERFKALDRTGADILKAAVMAKDFQDTVRLMQITDKVRREITFRPLIAIAMGKAGAVSRIAGESFGSCVTFAQMAEASAPGQISVHELLPMLKTLHGH